MTSSFEAELQNRIRENVLVAVGNWLRQNPTGLRELSRSALRAVVDQVSSPEMAGLLVDYGLDLTALSDLWSDGFGVENVRPDIAAVFVDRGLRLSPHSASVLGDEAAIGRMLDDHPALIHSRGGDGARPLHFCRAVSMARLLLSRGAEVDARDEDHDSTAAQWRIKDAPEVTRELLAHGATFDVFMAAGLGDLELAERAVTTNPRCTSWRIGDNSSPFPGVGFRGRGGTIYQWTLGFNRSPVEVARERGHSEVAEFLWCHTPTRAAFLIACACADRSAATEILASQPGLVASLSGEELGLMAKFCWETNLNPAAVALMLELGFPVDAPESNHGFQPLHNAAWCGHPGLVALLIRRGHPVQNRDPRYQGTPADWALHSALVGKRHPEGDFPYVLNLLFEAGGFPANATYPSGDPAIDSVWARHRATR